MKELMSKMDKPDMSGESDAKMQVLKELRDMAMQMMGDKLPQDEMKQVSVAAPDEEGLKEGLEMASAMAEEKPEMSMHDDEDMSLEEIEAQIAELEELRRAKMMNE